MIFISVLGTIIGGMLLYKFRCRKRFLYGAAEVAVSILIVVMAFVPHDYDTIISAYEPPFFAYWFWKAINWLIGLYIFVRGLDNIANDLPLSWRTWWARLF